MTSSEPTARDNDAQWIATYIGLVELRFEYEQYHGPRRSTQERRESRMSPFKGAVTSLPRAINRFKSISQHLPEVQTEKGRRVKARKDKQDKPALEASSDAGVSGGKRNEAQQPASTGGEQSDQLGPATDGDKSQLVARQDSSDLGAEKPSN
jgi:hypothetical protein